jgi:SAM-dependent methyltransferase
MPNYYTKNAAHLAKSYNALNSESVHATWSSHWPKPGALVLDIGAGSGRDASWLHSRGAKVYAVEPSAGLRAEGKQFTQGLDITWLSDALPELQEVYRLNLRFDLILLSGVWAHIPASKRERAFRKLSNLLAGGGSLVISLRHGPAGDERVLYDVSSGELRKLSQSFGLRYVATESSEDSLGRTDVHWETAVMHLPEDGSGQLDKVRQVLVNDNKTSSYKFALLRSLVRIADSYPGVVQEVSDARVALPLGLVALFWAKQYKRLLQYPVCGSESGVQRQVGIQQATNADEGLGFVKDAWRALDGQCADVFSIGASFFGSEAVSITRCLNDCIATIQKNPVAYTWHREKTNRLFEVERKKVRGKEAVTIDRDYLASFGSFILDESLWLSLQVFGSWIEPLLVSKWISFMRGLKGNEAANIPLERYYDALAWGDVERGTAHVRKRADELISSGFDLRSVWSGSKLSGAYHIDHVIPFAHWPSSDLWNLLPTTTTENMRKRDRVPKASALRESRSRVLDWWQGAFDAPEYRSIFFTQAGLALPGLSSHSLHFEEAFEAMQAHVRAVRDRFLIGEW